ncbi:MAG: hypothetical protein H0U79_05775 [Solirubrobacterales bacterium]|nr:hypothetical protein [Solirubrobacterales bacterium]
MALADSFTAAELVLVLGVLVALVAVAALAAAVAGLMAWEPPWLPGARHALAEAGWRVSGTWDEFVDWLRLGR